MPFSDRIKSLALGRQDGKCGDCGVGLHYVIYHAHHIKRAADGGADTLDNCVLLCEECHSAAHNYGNYRQPIELEKTHFKYFEYPFTHSRRKTRDA
jgi:5-methylcytosine-specific restriction protein A